MSKSLKSVVTNFLKYALGFLVLGYVIYSNWEPKNGGQGIKNLLGQTPDYSLLALMFLFTGVTISCQILRWYLLVRALDLPFTVRNAFRLGMIGYFYNTLLPGSVGGDAIKMVFIARANPGRWASAAATVVVDRLMGLFGLLFFSAAIGGSMWLSGDPQIANNDWLTKIIAVCSVLVIAAVAGWVILGFVPQPRAERIGERLRKLKYVGKPLDDVWEAVLIYRRRPKAIYQTLPLTAFGQVLMVVYLHLAVRVYPNPDPASLVEHFVIGPIGFIAQAFFPAPGGVGGAEYIFGYLYTILGRPEQTGVVGRLTLRVAEITLGGMGYIVYLSMKAELPATDVADEPKLPPETA
ncbi:lysylphosphatidylglycerol synthase transmembrane domain-containing protein [Limnoglobus roseus]|uniref:Uncharacterized protein n=1 Tax=Limnoglobus roseus TaxID=2598579 RepID=A0A5C1AD10_9BACT|nr:lysylphosphatidylglycerol synthase transmembrane domain-containing protein [Limnoglobus roseus]QEL16037.1 hypothetical protein PX52LOC_02975 [Limnoglobus roseus]